jgi:DNA-binding SARP family transcriptional activator
MSKLTLSFFGSFEAQLGDRSLINFRSAKIQGLLIYLVLTQQQAHNRNVLAALFWPDEPEDRAKHNLRHSLYRLRQLLEDDESEKKPFLLITRATVQFNAASHYSLDVADFLSAVKDGALETAVTHYHGDLLPGFSCDSLPFEDWLRAERERLHRVALDAFFECTALSLTRGDYANGQRLARQQLTLEPWREEAHQQLMQALALLGDRSSALAQYETCRRVLADELGVEPTAVTQTLLTRIRDQQLVPEIPHQADAPRPLTIPFVGRHREYEALVKAYQQTANNTLQIVSLVGNAGMGKTRLAQQFLAWAVTQGADILVGRSYETSAGLSYQPLTHLLRQRIERENAPEDLLSDLWLSQLTRLLPELRERYPDLPPPTQEENSARQHLFEAITRLGQALAARRPVVLFIDDWHWADDASRDVLQYAAQRWAEQQVPILILLTLRQEALTDSPALQSWFNQLKRAVAAEQLYVDKLSQTETEQLLHLLLSSKATNENGGASSSSLAHFSNWLFQETGGQPLFLTEGLKVLVEDGVLNWESNTAVSTDSGQAVWQLDWSRFDAQRAESRVLAGVREIIQGWLTRLSARAIATRCCWPPDISEGLFIMRWPSSTRLRMSAALSWASAVLRPAKIIGSMTFSRAVMTGIRLKVWKI